VKKLIARLGPNDAGFTLAEVVVSIVIVGILGLSAAYLSIRATQASASQQRASLATTVAVQAIEDVIARQAQTELSTGVTALAAGRMNSAVTASWAAHSGYDITQSMYPIFDHTAVATSTPRVPITVTRSLGGTDFTVATLVGSCYRATASGACTTVPGVLTRPATAPTGFVEAIRVAVIVEWTAGAGCSVEPCSYELVTMVDTNADIEWLTNG